jgi:hypothetical protein
VCEYTCKCFNWRVQWKKDSVPLWKAFRKQEETRVRTCGISVFTATTMYDFVAGRRKLFRAGCACWIPGGAFYVAVSWLAGGRNWGPEKGCRVSPFRWRLGALKRAVTFFFLFSRAAGWTPGGVLCVAASWLVWLGVLQYSRAAVFFTAAWSSLRQWLSAGDQAFYHGPLAEWSPSRGFPSRERGCDWRAVAMLAISSGASCDIASTADFHL